MDTDYDLSDENHSGPVAKIMMLCRQGLAEYIQWEDGKTSMTPKDVFGEMCLDKASAKILRHYGGVVNPKRRTIDVSFTTTRGEITATIEYAGDLEDFLAPSGRDGSCDGNRPILHFTPFETKKRKH